MRTKILEILKSKVSIYVFLIFLFFQVFKTQTYNLIYYLFDTVFLKGIITDTYTYNYAGKLLGCEQLMILKKNTADYSWFQRQGMFYFIDLPSLIAFFLLIKNKWKSKFTYWIFIAITCFSVLRGIVDIQSLMRITPNFTSEKYLRILIAALLFLFIGFYTFFFKMSNKDKITTIVIAFPAFVIGNLAWYKWLGPLFLPVVV